MQQAQKARDNAYCPYSKFKVGAAVIAENGRIYTGSNVENASYGLSCCAERVAVFKAISDGQRKLKAVAVSSSGKGGITPCGACLQVIYEFAGNADIIMQGKTKNKAMKIAKLLPAAFGRKNLLK
jgi:cytidine deaminase